MADFEKDEVPKLSETHPKISNEPVDSKLERLVTMRRSVLISIPMNSMEPHERERRKKFYNAIFGGAKLWARRLFLSLTAYIPEVRNPHAKVVRQWNLFFVICCLVGTFLDPLLFFISSVQKENKCIATNWAATTMYVLVRSMIDFVYFLNILLQFRLAYAPKSSGFNAKELVYHPKRIAVHYLKTNFIIDLLAGLPIPQIIIVFAIPKHLGLSEANYVHTLLRTMIICQYIPRLCRILRMLIYLPRFIVEARRGNILVNLLIFTLSGHVVGSCWYLFGLQRVNQCLQDACRITHTDECTKLINCGHVNAEQYQTDANWIRWKNNTYANTCFTEDGFAYGIYIKAVNLTTDHNVITRYVYSLGWGFQQISTLGGNLSPSYFVGEVFFIMVIIGFGLFFLSLLIGNLQNYVAALGRRRLEMSIRQLDVELWMHNQHLSEDLRRRVREAERYGWDATRGVTEEMVMENLPEDLQRDIRRRLFRFVKKVRIFALADEPMLDAICERLRQKTYIKGSKILYNGGLVEKMVFVVDGKLEKIGEDGIVPLSEGDACGEELLTWYLEHLSVNKDGGKVRSPGQRLLSKWTVLCLTNVTAFSLRAADLEEVTTHFATFFESPRVQGAIRYESTYWRCLAAKRIQVAWRYRKQRLSRADTSQSNQTSRF